LYAVSLPSSDLVLSANWNDFLRTHHEISETLEDVCLHLSIFEARDIDLHGGRHPAGWCDWAYKSVGTVKKGEWEGVGTMLHHQRESGLSAAEINGFPVLPQPIRSVRLLIGVSKMRARKQILIILIMVKVMITYVGIPI